MTNQTWLVAKNVYRNRIKGAGFWVMVLSPFLIALVYLIIGLVVSSGLQTQAKLAVVDNPTLAQVLKTEKALKTEISEVDGLSTAHQQLDTGKIDGFLQVENGHYTLTTSNKSTVKFDETATQQALTQINMLQTAQKLGLSNTDLQELLRPASLTMKVRDAGAASAGGDARTGANIGVATATAIVVMILLMMYVTIIAQEIANEKSSRIMETLLATTSSNVQYYGKILGVIALAITQVLIYVLGFGIASIFLQGNSTLAGISSMLSGMDVMFGIYALLMIVSGVLGYLFLASIIASLINEQAQVQQATQPLAFFSMIGYVGGIAGAAVPGNIVLRVLSFIPFVSPTLMTSRLAIQYSTPLEAWLALALQIVATLAVAKAGEKIYARNVLSYSSEKIFTQFLRNLRGKTVVNLDKQAARPSINQRLGLRNRLIIAGVIIVIVVLLKIFLKK